MMPITRKIFDKYGTKRLVIIRMFLLVSVRDPFVFLTQMTPILYIVIFYLIRMFDIPMVTIPVTTAGINDLPNNLISHGATVNSTFDWIASSTGTVFIISILTTVTNKQIIFKSYFT